MKIQNYIDLTEIFMVEDTIKALDYYPSKRQLYLVLKGKMTYRKINMVIEYLLDQGKIIIDKRKIFWTFNPKLMEYVNKYGVEYKSENY